MRKFCRTALLCLTAMLGNVVLGFTTFKLNIPLFLDTVFSVALAFYAGLAPALIVAVLYDPVIFTILYLTSGKQFFCYDFLYSICGMLIVFVSWFFSRKKNEFLVEGAITVLYLLIIAFISAFASFMSASLLDYFVRPLFSGHTEFSSTEMLVVVYKRLNFGPFLSCLLPRIPMTIIDRIICTFAGFGICRLMQRHDERARKKTE